jgi:hypothetical protein
VILGTPEARVCDAMIEVPRAGDPSSSALALARARARSMTAAGATTASTSAASVASSATPTASSVPSSAPQAPLDPLDLATVRGLMRKFREEAFPGLMEAAHRTIGAVLHARGGRVTSLFGRHGYFARDKPGAALRFVVESGTADTVKAALVRAAELGRSGLMRPYLHGTDEVVLRASAASDLTSRVVEDLRRAMSSVVPVEVAVPVRILVGESLGLLREVGHCKR